MIFFKLWFQNYVLSHFYKPWHWFLSRILWLIFCGWYSISLRMLRVVRPSVRIIRSVQWSGKSSFNEYTGGEAGQIMTRYRTDLKRSEKMPNRFVLNSEILNSEKRKELGIQRWSWKYMTPFFRRVQNSVQNVTP